MIIRNPINEHQVEVYQNSDKEWEWHVIHNNGSIVLKCSKKYQNYDDCANVLNTIFCKNKSYQILTQLSNEQWFGRIQLNGELLAITNEYQDKDNCENNLNDLLSEDYRKM